MTPRDERWIVSDELDPDEARRIRDAWRRELERRPVMVLHQAHPPRRIDWLAVFAWLAVLLMGAGVLVIILSFVTFLVVLFT